MTDSGGPYLTAAVICERVLQEQDGVISAIRIIDRVFFGQGPDGELLAPEHPITVCVTFKSGAARGNFKVRIRVEKPSGEEVPLLETPVFLEGEERGVNIVIQTAFAPDQQGLYWFDVFFEDERVTRMPLRAVYRSAPRVGSGE